MSEMVVLVLVTACSVAMFYIGHVLTRQHIEAQFRKSEDEFKRKLNHAIMEQKKLESDYAELTAKIKALGNSGSVHDFNELYKKVRTHMSFK